MAEGPLGRALRELDRFRQAVNDQNFGIAREASWEVGAALCAVDWLEGDPPVRGAFREELERMVEDGRLHPEDLVTAAANAASAGEVVVAFNQREAGPKLEIREEEDA